ALARGAARGWCGSDLSDAAHARHAAELSDGDRARGRPPAPAPGAARRVGRRLCGAGAAMLAAVDGTPPRRAGERARLDPPPPLAPPSGAAPRVPAGHARPDGRADHGVLSQATGSLLSGAPARVPQSLDLHARVR